MSDEKATGPDRANDQPRQDQTNTDTQIIVAAALDVNEAERIAMLATVDALEWFSLGRKHRSQRPAGIGALRWWRDKIPHRLEPVSDGYVCVVTENGTPMRNSLRRNARRAPKLWIPAEAVAWECLLAGNRLFDRIDDLLERRRVAPRKMLALRTYLVFERCGATRPILAASTWAQLEQEIRQTAGGKNPYPADTLPEWLSPANGRAVP